MKRQIAAHNIGGTTRWPRYHIGQEASMLAAMADRQSEGLLRFAIVEASVSLRAVAAARFA